MYRLFCPILLTVSQAFLAGALPAPRFISKSNYFLPRKSGMSSSDLWTDVCLSLLGAHGQRFEVGPPLITSYPNGNPFANPSTTYFFTPAVTATELESTISTPLSSGVNADPNPDSHPGGVAHDGEYSSTITFVDPHLSIQTITLTSLNSSQTATSTLENQSSLSPTGVRLVLSMRVSLLTKAEHYYHARDRRKSSSAAVSHECSDTLVRDYSAS